MKKDMLGEVVRKIVDLPKEMLRAICDLAEKLSGEVGQVWFAELKKFLRKEKCWADGMINILLEMIGTVTIPARKDKFISRENFIIDTSKKAKVKISNLGNNFKKNFLEKVEDSFSGRTLQYGRLKKNSVDKSVIAEIGGETNAETALVEMFYLMEKQGNGEEGVLLITNGYANIFYIRDANGVLWAVRCHWGVVGWRVDAISVDHPDEWNDGSQVFSQFL